MWLKLQAFVVPQSGGQKSEGKLSAGLAPSAGGDGRSIPGCLPVSGGLPPSFLSLGL